MVTSRLPLLLALIGACTFSPAAGTPSSGDDATSVDGGPPSSAARCGSITDPDLRLCVDFDTLPLADTSAGAHPLTASSVGAVQRAGDPAGAFTAASTLHVEESADLDLSTGITIEMWMRAELVAQDLYLIDNNAQYAMIRTKQGAIACTLAAAGSVDAGLILVNDWVHVGCTYDGVTAKIYVMGSVIGCADLDKPVAMTGKLGTAIGANLGNGAVYRNHFLGSLDNVHVYARALTPAQMCAAAGQSVCATSCP